MKKGECFYFENNQHMVTLVPIDDKYSRLVISTYYTNTGKPLVVRDERRKLTRLKMDVVLSEVEKLDQPYETGNYHVELTCPEDDEKIRAFRWDDSVLKLPDIFRPRPKGVQYGVCYCMYDLESANKLYKALLGHPLLKGVNIELSEH